MISKEEFIKYMTKFKKVIDQENELSEALQKMSPDFGGFSFDIATDLIFELLTKVSGDYSDSQMSNLEYFIYELNWGKDYKDGCITMKQNGKDTNIKLSNYEELYDEIVRCNEENKECCNEGCCCSCKK